MTTAELGSADRPLRVAIIGAGPAGFYTAEHLLKNRDVAVRVDLFERLPSPYGLVRLGVAPDHEKIRNVTAKFDATAARDGFRYFGNVEFGKDIGLDQMRSLYDQVVYCTGAQVDRRLGLPGEDLLGSHSATEFVAWYNGHPDYRDCSFDLEADAVAVIGVGNVAVDVARILCRTIDELATTDIADYALDALRNSKVKDVYMIGRRGPAQAAFTNPEAKELGELEGADIVLSPDEAALDSLSERHLEAQGDRLTKKKVALIQELAQRGLTGKSKRLHIRFLMSPTELVGTDGRVSGIRLVRNRLTEDGDRLRPVATDTTEKLDVGLVFRSVGYRGVPLADVPFDERRGVIANVGGRVVDATGAVVAGQYAAGWIKRGPSGVIGTNKADALDTVKSMLEDVRAKATMLGESDTGGGDIGQNDDAVQVLSARNVRVVSFSDWQHIDEQERVLGESQGRPRVKFVTVGEMLDACPG